MSSGSISRRGSVAPAPPKIQGPLSKYAKRSVFGWHWQVRHFVLCGDLFEWFVSTDAPAPQRSLSISRQTTCTVDPDDPASAELGFPFNLHHARADKTWKLRAKTERARRLWLRALSLAGADVPPEFAASDAEAVEYRQLTTEYLQSLDDSGAASTRATSLTLTTDAAPNDAPPPPIATSVSARDVRAIEIEVERDDGVKLVSGARHTRLNRTLTTLLVNPAARSTQTTSTLQVPAATQTTPSAAPTAVQTTPTAVPAAVQTTAPLATAQQKPPTALDAQLNALLAGLPEGPAMSQQELDAFLANPTAALAPKSTVDDDLNALLAGLPEGPSMSAAEVDAFLRGEPVVVVAPQTQPQQTPSSPRQVPSSPPRQAVPEQQAAPQRQPSRAPQQQQPILRQPARMQAAPLSHPSSPARPTSPPRPMSPPVAAMPTTPLPDPVRNPSPAPEVSAPAPSTGPVLKVPQRFAGAGASRRAAPARLPVVERGPPTAALRGAPPAPVAATMEPPPAPLEEPPAPAPQQRALMLSNVNYGLPEPDEGWE
jgi:hypothetical protein